MAFICCGFSTFWSHRATYRDVLEVVDNYPDCLRQIVTEDRSVTELADSLLNGQVNDGYLLVLIFSLLCQNELLFS